MNSKFLTSGILGILLVFGLFVFGCTTPNTTPSTPNNQTVNNSKAVALYFSHFSNSIPSTYYYEYNESINGVNRNVVLAKSDNETMVSIHTLPWDRQYYIFSNNSVIGCVNVNNPIYNATGFCSNATEVSQKNSYVQTDFNNIKHYPFSESTIKSEATFYKYLYDTGAMTFKPLGTCKWNGNTYSQLKYTIDYSNLTLQQLKRINLDPKTLPDSIKGTYCVDKDGFFLSKKIDQVWAGSLNVHVSMVVQDYSTGLLAGIFEYKYPYDNSTKLYRQRFGDGWRSYKVYAGAIMQGDQKVIDQTAKNLASNYDNPLFCNLISDKNATKVCYVTTAVSTRNPKVCDVAADYIKDDCYPEVAYGRKNLIYCNYVVDPNKKSKCFHMFDNETVSQTDNISNNTTNNTTHSIIVNMTNNTQ